MERSKTGHTELAEYRGHCGLRVVVSKGERLGLSLASVVDLDRINVLVLTRRQQKKLVGMRRVGEVVVELKLLLVLLTLIGLQRQQGNSSG